MAFYALSSSQTVSLAPQGVGASAVGYRVQVTGSSGWSGSLVLKSNTAPPGNTPSYVNLAYQNPTSRAEIAAGTAITQSGAFIVSAPPGDLSVTYTHTAGVVNVTVSPATAGVTNSELADAFEAAGFETAGQDTPVTMLSAAMAVVLGESLNVLAFGAVGDGVTDDTEAIQRAIDAADGREILLPSGYTFGLGDYLSLRDDTTLVGGKLLCLPSNTNGAIRNHDTTNGNARITLRGVEIDGNGANRTGSQNLVYMFAAEGQSCEDINILDCDIHSEIGTAGSDGLLVLIQRCHRGSIMRCRIHDGERDGINLMYDCQDFRVEGNYVYDVGDDGIALNAENGMNTGHVLTRVAIVGNVVGPQTSQGSGIAVRGGTHVTVTGNTVYRGFAEGIGISNWNTTAAQHVTVVGNTVHEAGFSNTGANGDGIAVQAGRSVSSLNGVAGCHYITIQGNTVKGSRRDNIRLGVGSTSTAITNLLIEGNEIECGSLNATGRGIGCVTGPMTDVTIADNEITDAQTQGIFLDGSGASASHTRIDVRGNRVLRSGQSGGTVATAAGIELASPIDANVSMNRSTDTRGSDKTTTYGVVITSPTGNLVLVGNDCAGNGTGFFNITNAGSLTRTRVANNPGYTPWAGQVSIASGTYTTVVVGGQTYYRKDSVVTYGLPFPSGSTPIVNATPDSTGVAAVALSGSNTGVTLRAWTLRDDAPAVVVQWQAESS